MLELISKREKNKIFPPEIFARCPISLWYFTKNLRKLDLQIWKNHPSCQILKLGSFGRSGSRLTVASIARRWLSVATGQRCCQRARVGNWASCQKSPDGGEAATVSQPTPASRKTQIIFEDKCFLQSTTLGRVLSYNSLSYLWKNLPERFLVSHSAILLVPDEERMVLCLRAGCCPPPPIPTPPPPTPNNLLFLPAALFCSKNHSATALETWPDRVPIFLSRKSDPLLA